MIKRVLTYVVAILSVALSSGIIVWCFVQPGKKILDTPDMCLVQQTERYNSNLYSFVASNNATSYSGNKEEYDNPAFYNKHKSTKTPIRFLIIHPSKLYLLAGIASIAIIAFWLLFFRKRLTQKPGLELISQRDTAELTMVMYTNLSIIKTYADIAYSYSHDDILLEKKLYQEVTSKIVEGISIGSLREILDFKYGDCRAKLLYQNPRLTDGDIDICYMIVAGLDNQQMSAMLKLGDVNSLYVKKNRLKSRLNIPASEKLENHVIKCVEDSRK